ncbi:MAG: RHS repeat-associated core domain-containing protein [Vicingaceae bacterium]|nr:MAG: RHS repeat-associated core domain-containing protein [Vicingaceae bacterium]
MMKSYIRIIIATLLLFGACKTQKPVVKDSISQTPIETVQSKTDTVVYNYPPPRNYNIPKRVFKEIENFETAFDELKAMLEGRIEPNFERAVFISENPYYNGQQKYDEFQRYIDFHLYFIMQLIAANDKSDSIDFNVKVNQHGRFNLDDIRHMPDEKKALYKKSIANWAIFKYITDTTYTIFFNKDTISNAVYHPPFTYASHDPFGIKDWSNSQVINLLYSQEQKGNCFALTALFKILSDRLQSDARICTAPQHIYIQHRDKKGDYYNVELATAGHPGDGTIQTLTHTTTEGIKSGIALRSFDTKQSIGLCLVNLAKSYEHKFGSKDDDFMLKCAELALKHDKLNLNALLLKQQILDTRVTDYAKENNINDINALKSNFEISKTVYELERHLALLYQLGYRQMPFDMQEIIMTGVIPENFEDKNPTPFTTIDPKDEHRKKFTTLYGGLFQEVFVTREFEPYGHFTFQTSTNKITVIDTTAQTGFIIDPVAFAYDFGARMYDARVGIFTSVDPLARKFPGWSPYAAFKNNPIVFVDPDGKAPVSSTGCCGGLVDELIDYAKRKASQAAYNLTVAAGKTLIQLTTAYVEHKLDEAVNSNNAFRSSVALTTEFVTGLGPQEREFGANHPFTQSLAKSNMTTEALKAFQSGYDDFKAGKRKDLPSSYRVDFSYGPGGDTGPFKEFFKDGEFTAAQFLGTANYTFSVDEKNKTLNISVFDTKTEYSFLYHAPGTDRHKRNEGKIMGETTQTYEFSIPLKDVKERTKK